MRAPLVLLLLVALAACSREPVDLEPVGSVGRLTVTDRAISTGFQDYAVGDRFKRGRGCTVADLDGDGGEDIVLLNPADTSFVMRNTTEAGGPIALSPDLVIHDDALAWAAVAGDIDNDGDPDLFVGVGGFEGVGFDRLLRNELVETGSFGLTDITQQAGVGGPRLPATGEVVRLGSPGVAFVDVDRDGWPDIWVDGHIHPLSRWNDLPEGSVDGRNTLWRNEGDGTFTDITEAAGLAHQAPTRFSSWLDVDGDGDLDLFENVWSVLPNRLWRNLHAETGEIAFEDATAEWSLDGDLGYPRETFVSATADLNLDGWPDLVLFVRGYPSEGPYRDGHVVLLNAHGQGFVDATAVSLLNSPFDPGYLLRDHQTLGVMGATVADVNGDGLPDVYIGNGGPAAGWPDQLFVTTGLVEHAFPGVGTLAVPRFENRSDLIDFPAPEADDAPDYPIYPYRTHAICVTDLDDDGMPELAVMNGGMSWFGGVTMREPNRLFAFEQDPPPRFLTVDVRGDLQVGLDGLGTVVAVTASRGDTSWTVTRDVRTSNGFAAQSSRKLWFGLADAERIDGVEVRWIDGRVDHLEPQALDRRIEITR